MRSVVIAILLLVGFSSRAQKLFISSTFNSHYTQEQLRLIIRENAWEVSKRNGIPEAIFSNNFARLEYRLWEKATPRVRQAATWLESTGGRFDDGLYRRELSRAIRDVVVGDPEFESLIAIDGSDRVLKHHSDIYVRRDGSIDVSESITIYNGDGNQNSNYRNKHPDATSDINNDVQRGIVRALVDIFKDKHGLLYQVPINVHSVMRDNVSENYHTSHENNSVLVFTGSSDVLLPDGIFNYVIQYSTNRQMAFHDSNDELYWNVNGTHSTLTTDSVTCKVTFPAGSIIEDNVCFTGPNGSRARNCTSKLLNDSTIIFRSTIPFIEKEGMTIGVFIQKGIIASPSPIARFIKMLIDNWPIPAMALIALILFVANYVTWFRVGKDPLPGTIIPQFDSPAGLSPADCGYIYKQQYKSEQFGAALLDIAVKKGIKIEVRQEGKIFKSTTYHFIKGTNGTRKLGEEVRKLYHIDIKSLYGQVASKSYNSVLGSMNSSLREHLASRFSVDDNKNNRGMFRLNSTAGRWQSFFLFMLGIGGVIAVILNFTLLTATACSVFFALAIAQQIVFSRIMAAYTQDGRKVMDDILGFRMYLTTAEEQYLDKMNPPTKTPELFEKYLPYAIALECQNQWSAKFETILKTAIADKTYTPTYYDDDRYYQRGLANFSDFGSFSSGLTSIISETSTTPSESGGSGGSSFDSDSGSSGGGGGGGGTGGW